MPTLNFQLIQVQNIFDLVRKKRKRKISIRSLSKERRFKARHPTKRAFKGFSESVIAFPTHYFVIGSFVNNST